MPERFTRRDLLQALGATGVLSALEKPAATLHQAAPSNPLEELEARIRADRNQRWQGSPLGNQYPFIKQVQEEAPQSLAFLKARPKDLEAWKAEARAKIFELLLYRPKPCDPKALILERVDKGDYIREYLRFHTSPDVEVGAYFLIPKGLPQNKVYYSHAL